MDHLIDDEEIPRHERELTLSTGSILGIFLGLVVLCGGFFGFGYNMGRKSAPTPLNISEVNPDTAAPSASYAPKPSPGSPLGGDGSASPAAIPAPRPVRHAVPPPATDADSADATSEPARPTPARTPPPAAPAPIVRQPTPVAPSSLNPSAAGPAAGGSFMVQVAAVSHQEDADLLVGALRGRGYAVSARPNAADNFIHVQIGPFHSKQEADAMRQRLLADGYNAIVKQ